MPAWAARPRAPSQSGFGRSARPARCRAAPTLPRPRRRPRATSGSGRLRALGETRQVLCITHLARVAALATSHFRIEKSAADDTALTTVEEIAGEGVVEELVRMLGAESSDGAARKHAEELLAAA